MIDLLQPEDFKPITFDRKLRNNYAISNHGRLVSYSTDILQGKVLVGSTTEGYRVFRYKYVEDGKIKNKHFFIGKLVAQYFIPKTSKDQIYVLHLDFVRDNDNVRNLQWATRQEMLDHSAKSPQVQKNRRLLAGSKSKNDREN